MREETKDWDTNSVNELFLSYNPQDDSRNVILNNHPQKSLTDWWHIEVKNRHKNKHAFTCLSYLTKIINMESNKNFEIPSIELIWSGLGDFTVNIMANGKRGLDAFYIIHGENNIRFQTRALTTTSQRFHLPVLGNGIYLLEYSVVSSNFEVASREFILKHSSSHNEVEFKPM